MGAILEEIYDIVTKKAGLKGRAKLAEKTGVPKARAAEEEDSKDLVAKFKKTASEIIGSDIEELLGKG